MRTSTWLLGAAAAAVLAVPFAVSLDLPGTDDQASAVATANRPGFVPHASPAFEPGDDAEPALFALQAGAGTAGVLVATGALWRRSRRRG